MPIEPPTEADRLRLRDDLRHRVELVRETGWSDYESTWSAGEVLGVRAVLDEEHADAALPLWAPTLWGLTDSETDAARGYPSTRWWFATVMSHDAEESIDLTRPAGWPPIDPDDGWATILTELRADLERIDPGHTVRQVKQKGGTLSVWVDASDPALADALHDRIAEAETESARTCERCGQPGRIRQRTDGWWQALCGEHAETEPRADMSEAPPPPTTVGELRALLEGVPGEALLLTDAYEGGFTSILAATLVEVQRLDRHGEQDYLGDYETVAEAQRQTAEPAGGSPWNPIEDFEPPTLIGEPVTALILTREGR